MDGVWIPFFLIVGFPCLFLLLLVLAYDHATRDYYFEQWQHGPRKLAIQHAISEMPTVLLDLIVQYESSAFFDETKSIEQIHCGASDAVFVSSLGQWLFLGRRSWTGSLALCLVDQDFNQLTEVGTSGGDSIQSINISDDIAHVHLSSGAMSWFTFPNPVSPGSIEEFTASEATWNQNGQLSVWIDGCPLNLLKCNPRRSYNDMWTRHFYLPNEQEVLVVFHGGVALYRIK